MASDIGNMKMSEMIAFAEMQAAIEEANPPLSDSDHDTSWATTLAFLRRMKERGVPEDLKDKPHH